MKQESYNYKNLPNLDEMTRDQVVPYYQNLIEVAVGNNMDEDIKNINAKIIKRWSLAALEYIKKKAWKNFDQQ